MQPHMKNSTILFLKKSWQLESA